MLRIAGARHVRHIAPPRPFRGAAAARLARARHGIVRVPRHVGFIPDGNRRWADRRRLPRRTGYAAGMPPGLALLRVCREPGIEEISVYDCTLGG